MNSGEPAPSKPDDETERALRANERFARAERLLEHGDVPAALALAAEALDLDPSVAEHLALHGYLLGLGSSDGLAKGIEQLDEAIGRDAYMAQAYQWRGTLHRKRGAEQTAQADFAHAFELNPSLIGAQREMRASIPPASRDRAGRSGAHLAVAPRGAATREPQGGLTADQRRILWIVVAGVLAVLLYMAYRAFHTPTVLDVP